MLQGTVTTEEIELWLEKYLAARREEFPPTYCPAERVISDFVKSYGGCVEGTFTYLLGIGNPPQNVEV